MSDLVALEFAHFARNSALENLELLHAHYVTHSFSLHSHAGYAIGVILEGAQSVRLSGSRTVFLAGNLAVIEPLEVHTGHARTRSGWRYRMMYPSVVQMENVALELGYCGVPHFAETTFADPELASQMAAVHALLMESHSSALERQSHFFELMAALMHRHGREKARNISSGRETSAVKRVRTLLEDDPARAWTLGELAREVDLNSFYLLRSFRKCIGLPPHAYQMNLRVQQAKKLLERGMGGARVALECGFYDQSHLTRSFKRVLGVGPGQYARAGLRG